MKVEGWFKVTRLIGYGASLDNGLDTPEAPMGDYCSVQCMEERITSGMAGTA